MGFKNIVKKGFTSGFSISRWMGLEEIKKNAQTIKELSANVLKKERGTSVKETFEECMRRYNLSEADLQLKIKNSQKIVYFCLTGLVLLLSYTLYLWVTTSFLSGLVSFMLAVVLAAYAFREDFNLFQMKQRRLGCTFQEWLQFTFKRN